MVFNVTAYLLVTCAIFSQYLKYYILKLLVYNYHVKKNRKKIKFNPIIFLSSNTERYAPVLSEGTSGGI